MSFLARILGDVPPQIDRRIRHELGQQSLAGFQVRAIELLGYRFVDLYRAVEVYFRDCEGARTLDSEHFEDLNSILHQKPPRFVSRSVKRFGEGSTGRIIGFHAPS